MSLLGEEVIAAVRTMAAENPEFVYAKDFGSTTKKCVYIKNGFPSCIIGYGLWNVGLIDDEFKGDEMALSDIGHIIYHYGWPIEAGEIDWLFRVQVAQDSGKSWAQAIECADDGWIVA